ncbi:unnamed protein product [Protopolystoma xenopodis]|uniref:Uncharacterized protein n=1 Tax=Protopolystoma xenopodis TaxID=117903 RepID=A0A3S5A7U5_9PLAT|nr:unnamed protein product [Protopolystoma xenopodis]
MRPTTRITSTCLSLHSTRLSRRDLTFSTSAHKKSGFERQALIHTWVQQYHDLEQAKAHCREVKNSQSVFATLLPRLPTGQIASCTAAYCRDKQFPWTRRTMQAEMLVSDRICWPIWSYSHCGILLRDTLTSRHVSAFSGNWKGLLCIEGRTCRAVQWRQGRVVRDSHLHPLDKHIHGLATAEAVEKTVEET